ncbi:hypothetical protein F443_01586 [Phytophthora nicotianae P1569]|uniref:Uncharacterized protein n=1 Tax=Phytophthora nicotianae P1569 TaxID=1317065 RepID=V9FYA5_PHYNI|nr:hypothetical protein F443_01586 [Phytophthora nicotianae P1569]
MPALLERRWSFLASWCAALKGKLRYGCVAIKGGLWETQRSTLHITLRREDTEGDVTFNFQRKLRKTREALALLAAVEHADYTAWRHLLTVHCGIDVGKEGEEKFEDRIPVRFLLCVDLKEEDSIEYDLVKFCGVDQRNSSQEFYQTLAKITALDKNIHPDRRGIDIEIPVQVFFSTDRIKPMEVSASELMAYGEAVRIIRDEWRQYEEGAENLPIARGSLRCTFVLEPLAVDFLGMMMHSEMIKTVEILLQNNIWFSQLKRLRLELHQDLWDNELESKKAFGQLFTGLFDSTRRTNLYSSKPDSFQLDQLQLFSISTMAASDFVALASALTVNQTVRKLEIQLSLQGHAQLTTRYWWTCLAYGLFSKRSRGFSSLESVDIKIHGIATTDMNGFNDIVTSEHPEEELLGFPHGAIEERVATLKGRSSMRWQFNYRGEPNLDSDLLSIPSPVSFVRTFSDDGVSEWVNVVIPGYGHCQVQRENLEFYEPSSVNSGPRLSTLNLEIIEPRSMDGLPLLLAAIGASLKVLTLKVRVLELDVNSILRSCPNLVELSLSTDMMDIQLVLDQSHEIQQSLSEFSLDLNDITSLSRSLSDGSNSLSKCVRRLRVRPANCWLVRPANLSTCEADVNTCLDMLAKNQSLSYFEVIVPGELKQYMGSFRQFHLQPTLHTLNLPLESKLALISAVYAPMITAQAVNIAARERSSLHELSQDMLCKIFACAIWPISRQVFFQSQHVFFG